MNSPKISIIIPSLQQGEFIEETILSIIGQNYKNFEIIIIDGGSTDNTVEVIKKHKNAIGYWISEKDNGQSEAINKGLKFASGEIVTWLNSDDYYEAGALETIVKLFEQHPEVDIIHGKSRFFDQKNREWIVGPATDLALCDYLPFMRFPQPSSFFRKKFLGPDSDVNQQLHYTMDFELVARALLLGARIKRTDHLLSHYRLHPGSKSNHELKFLEEWTKVVYNVFSSLKNGHGFAEKLLDLNLYSPGERNTYECKITFTDLELESIFLQHLHLHYLHNYKALNHAKCRTISNFLREKHRGFYMKNNYNRYNFKLKFIPRFIFTLIRKSGR